MKKSAPSPPHELVRARQGAECVYREKGYIIHAVLDEIRSDKWGVRLKLRDLDSPGFTGRARPHAENPFWEVGGHMGHVLLFGGVMVGVLR